MDVDSNSDGQSTSYIQNRAHKRIRSLGVMQKNIEQVPSRGFIPINPEWKNYPQYGGQTQQQLNSQLLLVKKGSGRIFLKRFVFLWHFLHTFKVLHKI